jgi:hypothetical protein
MIGNPAAFNEVHRLTCGNRPGLCRSFNHPTDCAWDSVGRLYVADAYGNFLVHVLAPDCSYSHSLGSAGAEAGKFSIPYAVAVLKGDRIAVADREYKCVQIFAPDDSVERQIPGLCRSLALAVHGDVLLETDQTPCLSAYDADGTLISFAHHLSRPRPHRLLSLTATSRVKHLRRSEGLGP